MLKVLIVENELIMADMIEEVLVRQGYEVCGIGRTVCEAVAPGRRHEPDIAVIDIRLADGELGTEVALQLRFLPKLGILYASGNLSQVQLSAADGVACIAKPYRFPDLLRSLEIVADYIDTGRALPPFPNGFQMLSASGGVRRGFPHG